MLTYGIFLFLSIFPIIHPKGLAQHAGGKHGKHEAAAFRY